MITAIDQLPTLADLVATNRVNEVTIRYLQPDVGSGRASDVAGRVAQDLRALGAFSAQFPGGSALISRELSRLLRERGARVEGNAINLV